MTALNDFSILLLIAHYLGDYQLQWDALAKEKAHKVTGLLKHFAIHFSLLIALFIWGYLQGLGWALLWPILIIFGVHVVLDTTKYLINPSLKKKLCQYADIASYVIDQTLHLLAIMLLSQVFFAEVCQNFALGRFLTRDMLNWALLVVLITKPANVSFKTLFKKYQNKPRGDKNQQTQAAVARMAVGLDETRQDNQSAENESPELESLVVVPGAGAVIGNMERILSAIFLSVNQWAAIGVIFTAKSIARFKQIEEDKQFAKYYLIGTLYSILSVVLAYFLVFKV